MTLITHHLEFSATAVTPLELDDQAGAAIRGAIVGGLWERFCTNKAARVCADCPLLRVCPVAALIAPMRDEGETGGAQRPRPYTVCPPLGARRFAPGEPLTFGLTLIGHPVALFPYVVMAVQSIEHSGLGRHLPANNGRRGTLQIDEISAVNPLTGARQLLYQRGQPQVQAPGLPVALADIAAYAATLPANRLTLHFQTPLRLIDDQRLVKRFDIRPFVQRLAWRLDQFAIAYGDGAPMYDCNTLLTQVAQIRVADDQTRWIDVVSYSSRTRERTPIGGLIGAVTLAGDLAELRELLVWGMLIHVGKNAVKGDGRYCIGADDS